MPEREQKQTSPEFRKTILIGLGGAGQQMVLRTKRFFLDTYGVVPPSVKILCLDTDDESLSLRSQVGDKTYAIEPGEFLHLQVDNPQDFIDNSSASKWYVKPVPVSSISHGAGAVRQNGRLAFFYHINEIKRRIDRMLAELNDVRLATQMAMADTELGVSTGFRLSPQSTEIYVCGSVAGGTGSGTFVDVGILLRRQAANALIHGFFILPWVYRNKAFAYRVTQNAYAALSELDNLQSIMYGSDRFYRYDVGYAEPPKPVDKAPYDLFHVIDGRNDLGENVDSVHDLCETIANGVFLSMGAMAVKVTSVVDNLLAHINVANPRLWKGRYARYSSLGVSSIHYPAAELHRLVSASNALALCRSAMREIEAGAPSTDANQARRERASEDAERFITQHNLHRNNVKTKLCPRRSAITFDVESYEMSDADFPALLKDRLASEKKALDKALSASFEGHSRVYAEETVQSLDQRLRALADDPETDRSARREWSTRLSDHVGRLRDAAAQELVTATEQLENLRKNTDALLEIAEKSRYIPVIGGHRKSATTDWAEGVGDLLTQIQEERNLTYEKAFYEKLLTRLESERTLTVPTESDIYARLEKAEQQLQKCLSLEEKNLEILRNRPNHVLLGYGHWVILEGGDESNEGSKAAFRKPQTIDQLHRPYPKFTQDAGIHSVEQYLEIDEGGPERLTSLFLDYCLDRHAHIGNVTVVSALTTLAAASGDEEGFKRQQFEYLFRLAAPLWSFERGRLSEVQSLQTDKIVNIGLFDHEKDLQECESVAQATKHAFHIRSDLAYSTTGDPHHIWMLSFAAAIPAYLITGLEEAREAYEAQMTPSFHIDAEFEKNVPDLFPQEENADTALRLLGMAIVDGIDVIQDEKLSTGHKFIFGNAAAREMNFDEPMVWYLFRDMYAEFRSNPSGLLDLLRELLKEKVESMDTAELRTCIEQHIEKLKEKLAKRDFSRLVSARLTYREIRALEDFLEKRGFGMNIERYIAGG